MADSPRPAVRDDGVVRLGYPQLLGMAAWFALATGLIEAAALAMRLFVMKSQVLLLGVNSLWMAPVGNLLWFGLASMVLVLLSLRWPRLMGIGPVLGVFGFLAAFAVAPVFIRLHWLAYLFLALGAGAQMARMAEQRSRWFTRLVSGTLGWSLGAVVLLAAGVLGSGAWQEHRARSLLPRARAGAPNVLLLVLDTVRAMNLSLYGYARPTSPNLERWARRGVRFDLALSAASWTLPSHAAMFTGRWPHEQSSTWRRALDGRWPTVAEILRDQGYLTAGFVGNLQYCSRIHGLSRGFDHYEDFPVNPVEMLLSTSIGRTVTSSLWLRRLTGYDEIVGRRHAPAIDAEFLRWEAGHGDRPFFGFINYYDAHQPFMPEADIERQFASATPRKNAVKWYGLHEIGRWDQDNWTPAELQREMDAYDASITQLDRDIGGLLDALDRRGDLRNTVVIITSDHGELFGEHGLHNHGSSLYSQVLNVPLLVIYPPRVPAGSIVSSSVSLRDIAATILDLTGVPSDRLPGASLAPYWGGATVEGAQPRISEVVRPDGKAMTSVEVAGRHLIRNPDGSEELFRLPEDLTESTNLLPADSGAPWLPSLRTILDSLPPQPDFKP